MSRFNVLLCDKDNDLYTTVISNDNRDVVNTVAQAFSEFVYRGMVINGGYDYAEPFDCVYIQDRLTGEYILVK